MKRSGIVRKTPLKAASRPVAGTKRKTGTRQRYTGPDATTRALVAARALGGCERCGRSVTSLWDGWSIHHRLPRGRGGQNSPENLIFLCGSGTTGCHGLIESERLAAYLAGLLLRTGTDPASEPVLLRAGWVFLCPDGSTVSATDSDPSA